MTTRSSSSLTSSSSPSAAAHDATVTDVARDLAPAAPGSDGDSLRFLLPPADTRLRTALEKLVVYEYRVSQLQAELDESRREDGRSRAALAEARQRIRAMQARSRAAEQAEAEARSEYAELRARVARGHAPSQDAHAGPPADALAWCVTPPPAGAGADAGGGPVRALAAAHGRIGELEQALSEMQVALEEQQQALGQARARVTELETERRRFLDKMIEFQGLRGTLEGDEALVDLASFIAELRAENLTLAEQVRHRDEGTREGDGATSPEVLLPAPPLRDPAERLGAGRAHEDPQDLSDRMLAEGRLDVHDDELTAAAAGATFPSATEDALFRLCLDELRSPSARARRLAAVRLAGLGTPAAVPALIATLRRETDARVRRAIVEGCGRLSRSNETESLMATLAEDGDPGVRVAALAGLSHVGNADAQRLLERSLTDAAVAVRRRVATLLGYRGDTSAVAALVPLLQDKDAGVRRSAVVAVGMLAHRAGRRGAGGQTGATAALSLAVTALRRAAHDRDDLVRGHAARSLEKLGERAEAAVE